MFGKELSKGRANGFTPLERKRKPKVTSSFLTGFTLVEVMIVVGIIALLAAMAIPGLLRARLTGNEGNARATLKTISNACENYAAANEGNYPAAIAVLTGTNPPYLNEDYTATARQGYNFACDTMKFDDYSCTATPVNCNVTGGRNFTITIGGVFSEVDCGG